MRLLTKIIFLLTIFPFYVLGQNGVGSQILENSRTTISSNSTKQVFSERLYFGPQTDWVVDGVLEIWCKEIWIAPEAQINGQGRIIILNPGTNPYYPESVSTSTTIDGNNSSFINLILEHSNKQGIKLGDIADPGYGVVNPRGPDAARLNLGSSLILQENGGHVFLNGNHLGIGAKGRIENFGKTRMVLTSNQPQGHLIKTMTETESFVFPLGIRLQDYTPLTVSLVGQSGFNSGTSGQVYANVVDETSSPIQLQYPEFSIKRSWNVFSPEGLRVNMIMDHGDHTPQKDYQDINASIIQYLGGQKFEFLATTANSANIHQASDVKLAIKTVDPMSWFTKYSGFKEGIHIPNAITPNGDGINDQFVIGGLAAFDVVELTVFSRWGNIVYSSKNYSNNWNGKGLNAGTYYYIIQAKKGNITRQFKGWVLLYLDRK